MKACSFATEESSAFAHSQLVQLCWCGPNWMSTDKIAWMLVYMVRMSMHYMLAYVNLLGRNQFKHYIQTIYRVVNVCVCVMA